MKSILAPVFAAWFSLMGFTKPVAAQNAQQDVIALIQQKDSLFWKAYNTCDVAGMSRFFTSDMEFYHDKGGHTTGLEPFTENTRKNLCSNENFRLRREAVAGSVQVFPMAKNGVVYGAIISGSHVFYINEKGKPEYLDGLAKFTHLWLLEGGEWKMSRVLSFDHGPAVYQNKRKEIQLTSSVLNQFAGTYISKQKGPFTVKSAANNLLLTAGSKTFTLYPETSHTFFVKEQDLTIEFNRDHKNKVKSLVVREKGAIVDEAMFR